MMTKAGAPPNRRSPLLDGIEIAPVSEAECAAAIVHAAQNGVGGWVVTVNTDILRSCRHDDQAAAMVGRATTRVADGMPLVWAARVQGNPLPERVTGSNLVPHICALAAADGVSVYFLGGRAGNAEASAQTMTARYPNLAVAGIDDSAIRLEDASADEASRRVVNSGAHVVFVALGALKQEWFIDRFRDSMQRSWWIGVGATFEFLAGDVPRAPRWMQSVGLEWLHRLAHDPRRLFTRYFVHDAPYALGLLLRSANHRLRSR
jgi:N-acetylglucosaminyldiphosphoundecaprenol N-acetyl-beta-D-mannosaminyltransferase